MAHPGGRPRKFKSVDEMKQKIDEYFKHCDDKVKVVETKQGVKYIQKPYTVQGLCVYLDITTETLLEYAELEEFSSTIKKAKKIIEAYVVENATTGEINPIFSMFNLKNNFGWQDKHEVEATNLNINNDISDLSDDDLTERLSKLGIKIDNM